MDRFRELSRATNFPWLCSNAVDKGTGKPLAGCKAQRVFEWHGVTVGVMGLVEYGWLAGLTTLAEDQVGYTDYCEAGAALARSLRANGADLVVALTRMATASGERLAREVPDIDIVLGGHGQEAGVSDWPAACDDAHLGLCPHTHTHAHAATPLLPLLRCLWRAEQEDWAHYGRQLRPRLRLLLCAAHAGVAGPGGPGADCGARGARSGHLRRRTCVLSLPPGGGKLWTPSAPPLPP